MGRPRQYRNNASRQRAYRKREKRDRRLALRQTAVMAVSVPGVFRVLYADCPWDYDGGCFATEQISGGASAHYPTMSVEELCEMQLPAIADDAVLFLWSPAPMFEKALQVISAWRFVYKTNLVWDKQAHNFGHYSSVRHEHLLLATRGSCLPDVPDLIDSVQTIERREHSRKPVYFRELIDKLYRWGNRIELFARGSLPEHWAGWGNEFAGLTEVDSSAHKYFL